MKEAGFVGAGGKLAAMLFMVLLAGCSTTAGVETTGKTAWDDQGARTLEKKVLYNSFGIERDIEVTEIKSSLAGDIMKVQATVRSRDRDTLPFQYRFDWLDSSGMELNPGSGAWKPLILYGRETKVIQGVAPDSRGREFRLKIREPD